MTTRWAVYSLLLCLLSIASIGCARPALQLERGSSRFVFSDPDGDPKKQITVWYYNPGITPSTQVVFVMHGRKRNGEEYRDAWITHAQKGHFLLLVPEFSKDLYPESEQYNLGNMFSESGKPVDESRWTFTAIERIFDRVKAAHELGVDQYDIYGHSAGAQFVHRFVLFKPAARVRMAIAANAGWYTMPDFKVSFPYGLARSGCTESMLGKAFSKKLVVLLGSEDTDPDHKSLRKTPEALAQGKNRVERGEKFFNAARTAATTQHVPFNWERKKVLGVAHSNKKMAGEAALLLAGN